MDSLFSNITLECSLDRPDPSVVFSFNISVVFENVQFNVTRILLQEELTIDDGIFELSDVLRSLGLPRELAIIMDIFFNDIDDIYSTIITSVICVASNGFGEDDATSSHISVCGTTKLRILFKCNLHVHACMHTLQLSHFNLGFDFWFQISAFLMATQN